MPISIDVLAVGTATDVLDGALARRGASFDAAAELLFALGAYAAFVAVGVHPYRAPLVIVAAFAWFAVLSGSEGPRYDPVGRHYGTVLYAGAALILTLEGFAVPGGVLGALVLMSLACLATRLATRRLAPGSLQTDHISGRERECTRG